MAKKEGDRTPQLPGDWQRIRRIHKPFPVDYKTKIVRREIQKPKK